MSYSENVKEKANIEAPENNPQYRTVYVGNLAHEVVSSSMLLLIHLLCFATHSLTWLLYTIAPLLHESLCMWHNELMSRIQEVSRLRSPPVPIVTLLIS